MSYEKHEDERRVLYDWASGVFKSAKAVIVKQEMAIGDHYHLKKTEQFFLLHGSFKELTIDHLTDYDVPAPHFVDVPPGVYHKFICEPGSILLGVANELFDPNDEIKQ